MLILVFLHPLTYAHSRMFAAELLATLQHCQEQHRNQLNPFQEKLCNEIQTEIPLLIRFMPKWPIRKQHTHTHTCHTPRTHTHTPTRTHTHQTLMQEVVQGAQRSQRPRRDSHARKSKHKTITNNKNFLNFVGLKKSCFSCSFMGLRAPERVCTGARSYSSSSRPNCTMGKMNTFC